MSGLQLRCFFGALFFVVTAGCSQAIGPSRFQSVPPVNAFSQGGPSTPSFHVLHNFGSAGAGQTPLAGLLAVNGTLYGTTSRGGKYGNGTVFSIGENGSKYRVLHDFKGSPDGAAPAADMIDVHGALYGTTTSGVVFRISPTGANERVVWNAPGGSNAPLVDAGGTLYGTTQSGGTFGWGTVFSVTPAGRGRTIYSFGSNGNQVDAHNPLTSVILLKGTLYGTTSQGGVYNCGAIYSINPIGVETVVELGESTYCNRAKAGVALLFLKGTFYGLTAGGGTYPNHFGTFFNARTTGGGSVNYVYDFGTNHDDGKDPQANLVYANGTFYGTTSQGGASNVCPGGCGTVFSITPTGTERVLHSFDGLHGSNPQATLTYVNGTLYGTTSQGGTSANFSSGVGTIFSLKVP